MLSYMDGKAPDSEYTKMLDDAVREIKQSEERRIEYMSGNAYVADERALERYVVYVEQIRSSNGRLSDDDIVAFMHIKPDILGYVRTVIAEHPDWDDEEVADEVIAMEDKINAEKFNRL